MPNPLQRIRSDNIAVVKRIVAKSMPTGIPDAKLRGILSVQFGFGAQTIAEYLKGLEDMSEIEHVDGVWRVVCEPEHKLG